MTLSPTDQARVTRDLTATAPDLLVKAEKLADEAERVALAMRDAGRILPLLERAVEEMKAAIAKAKEEETV